MDSYDAVACCVDGALLAVSALTRDVRAALRSSGVIAGPFTRTTQKTPGREGTGVF